MQPDQEAQKHSREDAPDERIAKAATPEEADDNRIWYEFRDLASESYRFEFMVILSMAPTTFIDQEYSPTGPYPTTLPNCGGNEKTVAMMYSMEDLHRAVLLFLAVQYRGGATYVPRAAKGPRGRRGG
ncbi:hypothetical protein B0I35DRAFT_475580 [Stachybotrys elegans]|uniref:Uncharacterized protein n=1 Tax=Stachybotrys elegans TaxID=80388 RepID=A0A8K0SVU9_9HYPO|nr:hypothetical protein B0I35DRAFT_475580 [Stachybotrys elegans]